MVMQAKTWRPADCPGERYPRQNTVGTLSKHEEIQVAITHISTLRSQPPNGYYGDGELLIESAVGLTFQLSEIQRVNYFSI